jgi:hypothetical protein
LLIKSKWNYLQKIINSKWNYLQKIIKGPASLSLVQSKKFVCHALIKIKDVFHFQISFRYLKKKSFFSEKCWIFSYNGWIWPPAVAQLVKHQNLFVIMWRSRVSIHPWLEINFLMFLSLILKVLDNQQFWDNCTAYY